jgi:hypothetical protein
MHWYVLGYGPRCKLHTLVIWYVNGLWWMVLVWANGALGAEGQS